MAEQSPVPPKAVLHSSPLSNVGTPLVCAAAFVLGALSALLSWHLGGELDWRLDAGAALAAALTRGLAPGIAAAAGAVLVAVVSTSSLALASLVALSPVTLALLGGVRPDLFQPVDDREPTFLTRLGGWTAAVGAVVATVQSVALSSSLALAPAAWLGLLSGVLLVTPLLILVTRAPLSASMTLAIAGIAAGAAAALFVPEAHLPLATELAIYGLPAVLALWLAQRGWGGPALSIVLAIATVSAYHHVEPTSVVTAACSVLAVLALTLHHQRAGSDRADAARRADQGLFDAMMRFLPVGLYRTDVDGTIRYANPMFRALTGISGESMVDWRDVVHPDDRPDVETAWQRFQRGQAAFDQTYRVQPLGTVRWVQVRISPEYDRGNVAGYIGTVTDITSQKLAEAERNRTEAHSRAILDSAVDAIVSIDESGVVKSFNQGAQRMFGYAAEEVIGHNVAMLMPSPHADRHDDYIRRYVTTGEERIIGIGRELEARRKDGSLLPIHLAVSEVTVDGTRNFTGIMRDISRDRAAAEEIRRQHELLSVTVQNAPMGIATYRFGAALATANRALEALTGYGQERLLAMPFGDLIDADDRSELDRLTADAQSGRISRFAVKLKFVRADGTRVPVALYGAVTHDAMGVPNLVIVQAADLTSELQAAEKERLHQEELTHFARLSTLGEMTAGIAHEINQPLTAIAMYAQSGMRMIDAGIPDPARLREAMEKLKTQSLRAGAVIDRIQRLVRHREGVREPVALNELVTDILRLAESDARVNDMKIELDLASELPLVAADPIQIQQVLLNLVRNAIDAMKGIGCRNGRTVVICTRPSPQGVCVSVVDSGTGVSDDFEPQLFTPFATTKEHGMGMGLSICRSIIEDHGGHLTFANNDAGVNAGHGATFYFELPQEAFSEES